MTNKTSWVAGAGAGLTWTIAFNSTDFTNGQPTNNQCLLSTVTITNGTALDQFADFSIRQSISSSTIAAGANFTLWLCSLKADGSTYWPTLTAGTAASSATPPWAPCAVVPIFAAASQTTLIGASSDTGSPILLPPGSFKFVMQNNCGFTLTSGTQEWDYRTYNQNLNA